MSTGTYGKNPNNLKRVTGYGGSVSQRAKHRSNKRKAGRGGGGVGPYWKDNFRPPEDFGRVIRIIPGEYAQLVSDDGREDPYEDTLEYVVVREHYHGGKKRGILCSGGPRYMSKDHREECEGCNMFWEDYDIRRQTGDKQKPRRVSMSEKYVFTVWDYGLYLKLPRTDAHGNVIKGNQGTPYYDWVTAPDNDPRQHQVEHKFGHLCAWPMSRSYFDYLMSYNEMTIRNDCGTCGAQKSIELMAKICSNPKCGVMLYDPSDSTLSPEQVKRFDEEPITCHACGHTDFAQDLVTCAVCEEQGLEPRRASIFDIDLEIVAVPSGDGKQKNLSILSRSEPRPINVQDPDILAKIQPLDLLRQFAPTPVEKQREVFGISVQVPDGF